MLRHSSNWDSDICNVEIISDTTYHRSVSNKRMQRRPRSEYQIVPRVPFAAPLMRIVIPAYANALVYRPQRRVALALQQSSSW
jgi:hypothetical protein